MRTSFALALAVWSLPLRSALAGDGGCGTVMPPHVLEWIREMHDSGAFEPAAIAGGGPTVIPVTIHLVHQSDGSGGATLDQVGQALIDLQKPYLETTFRFCLAGPVRHINDTEFYSQISQLSTLLGKFDAHNVAETVNIYVVESLTLGTPINCGYTAWVTPEGAVQPPPWHAPKPPRGIAVKVECFGTDSNHTTVPHEMGHYLTLTHTHGAINGPTCPASADEAGTGDLLSDTPADPNLRRNTAPVTYHVTEAPYCVYDDTTPPTPQLPPGCKGFQPPYEPDTHNLMSYSRPCCRRGLTPLQIGQAQGSFAYVPYGLASLCSARVQLLLAGTQHDTISGAVAAASSGEIIVAGPGTYAGGVDLQGKSIRLIATAGPDETIIDVSGTPGSAVTIVGAGPGTELEGFTITGGTGTFEGDCPEYCFEVGGGLHVKESVLTIRNCRITGNTAFGGGGGIRAAASDVTLAACTLSANRTTGGGNGGGIQNLEGSMTLRACDIIGGEAANETSHNFVAEWAGGPHWQPLGEGTGSIVRAVGVYNSSLIVGGSFTSAGGAPAANIARWTGSTWQPLGSGVSGPPPSGVHALTVLDGKLIAGGYFTVAGGVVASCVASWDGSAWDFLDLGCNNLVRALTVHNLDLIAGGHFTTAGSVAALRIARWTGSGWQAIGGGMNDDVAALAVYGGDLIAGGSFTSAGGNPACSRIARWDGQAWQPMQGGMNNPVLALAVWNGTLIAGGSFTMAGGVSASRIAAWDGSSWQPLPGAPGGQVDALAVAGSDLIVGGSFAVAGGVSARGVARWDGSAWHAFGSGLKGQVAGIVAHNGQVFAGGSFSAAGDAGERSGGGIHNTGQMALTNCVLRGNLAHESGGAAFNGGTLSVTNCTFVQNDAVEAGADVYGEGERSQVAITGSILWAHKGASALDVVPAALVSFSNVEGGASGSGNIDSDPLFVDLAGGDLRLRGGSPCIDAADSTALAVSDIECDALRADRDGAPRLMSDACHADAGIPGATGGVADMGAFERQRSSCDLGGSPGVGIQDFLTLLQSWGPCPAPPETCPADFDGDGSVGIADFLLLLSSWG